MENKEKMKKIKNIGLEHFKTILFNSYANPDILNIYLFYRENSLVETQEFKNYLRGLDCKKLIYNLFGVQDENEFIKMNKLQKIIRDFDYNLLDEEEKNKLNWLLYDIKDGNGKFINDKMDSRWYQKSELYMFFTDKNLEKRIHKKLEDFELGFFENERGTKKYLKFIRKTNINSFEKFSCFVINENKNKRDKIDKENIENSKGQAIIDHIQKPPYYFYDFRRDYEEYYLGCKYYNLCDEYKEKKKGENYKKIYKNIIKEIIYLRIIEFYHTSIRNKNIIKEPQNNNCYYNLKYLDENVNKRLKATLIDRSNIIYPRRDLKEKNKFYVTFYFTKTQCLKINNKYEKIVALSIIYNFDNISYEDIIDELDKNIFIKNKNLSVDERLDFNMLSNYIRGKNILVLKEKKDDTNQRGIIATREFFDEDTKNSKLIINYNE